MTKAVCAAVGAASLAAHNLKLPSASLSLTLAGARRGQLWRGVVSMAATQTPVEAFLAMYARTHPFLNPNNPNPKRVRGRGEE